jgi:hypothetical protein
MKLISFILVKKLTLKKKQKKIKTFLEKLAFMVRSRYGAGTGAVTFQLSELEP